MGWQDIRAKSQERTTSFCIRANLNPAVSITCRIAGPRRSFYVSTAHGWSAAVCGIPVRQWPLAPLWCVAWPFIATAQAKTLTAGAMRWLSRCTPCAT